MNTPMLLDPAQVAASMLAAPAQAEPSQTPTPPKTGAAAFVSAPEDVAKYQESRIDRGGHAFDGERHKIQPDGRPFVNRYGFFMPKGGKRPNKTPAPVEPFPRASTAPTNENATPAAVPPKQEQSAWGQTERDAAAGLDPSATAAAGDVPPGAGAGVPPSDRQAYDNLSEDAAEVGTRTLYFTVGVLIGSTEEATPDKADHENFRQAAAAYIRTTGWKGTALTCLVLRACAYLLKTFQKPKAAEKVRIWLADFKARAKKKPEPTPVQHTPAPGQPATPARVSLVPKYFERPA